ncbi:MAG: molybdopterin-dependent oxidoreductase, partial [Betaproteobacteria bacterium]|nr:molybdopterin-dependent oxidoreductase [Betaproteobacteria bacterium]
MAAARAPRSRLRRRLLIAAGLAGGALAVGGWLFYRSRDRLRRPAALRSGPGEHAFNAWLKIAADGTVLVQVPRQEMGQGISTMLPLLVAEELDCDPAKLAFEQAPIDPVYANATILADGVPFRPDDQGWLAALARHTHYKFAELLGVQATGGSSSVRDAWLMMRHAGAAARALLVAAAAERWNVAAGDCRTEAGAVLHPASGRRLGYGELAAQAAQLAPPPKVKLKEPGEFRLLGKPQPRLDVPAKTDGAARFGADVRLPGMLYAAIVHCPVFGGTMKSFNGDKARASPGVRAVLELPATSTSAAAVAVVADNWWRAKNALAALEIKWDEGPHAALDSARQREAYLELLEGSGRVYEEIGDVESVFRTSGKRVDATYEVP